MEGIYRFLSILLLSTLFLGPIFSFATTNNGEPLDDARQTAYIIHRGHEKDPGIDQFPDFGYHGCEVWQ